jgi:putative hydrolase of the HAD superfamily
VSGSETERSAVLLDFGGVLTTSVHAAFRAFAVELGAEPDLVLRLLSEDAVSAQLLVEAESGRMEDEDFEAGFAARLGAHGVEVSPDRMIARMQAGFGPDQAMLDAVAALRAAGLKTAMVTNSFGRDCYAGFDLDAIADVVVISGQVGIRKPSRRIYALACEQLGVAPEACVLVDDIQHNLDGAAKLGIAGVLHVDAAQTVRELDERFGIRGAAVPAR